MNQKASLENWLAGLIAHCADQQALLDLEEGLFEIDWLPAVLEALNQYADCRELTAPLMRPPQVLFDSDGHKTILLHHYYEGKTRHFCIGFPLTPEEIESANEEFSGPKTNVQKGI